MSQQNEDTLTVNVRLPPELAALVPDIMHGLHMLYTPAKWPDVPAPDRDTWKLTRIRLSGYGRECLETLAARFSNQHICTAALMTLKATRERGKPFRVRPSARRYEGRHHDPRGPPDITGGQGGETAAFRHRARWTGRSERPSGKGRGRRISWRREPEGGTWRRRPPGSSGRPRRHPWPAARWGWRPRSPRCCGWSSSG